MDNIESSSTSVVVHSHSLSSVNIIKLNPSVLLLVVTEDLKCVTRKTGSIPQRVFDFYVTSRLNLTNTYKKFETKELRIPEFQK